MKKMSIKKWVLILLLLILVIIAVPIWQVSHKMYNMFTAMQAVIPQAEEVHITSKHTGKKYRIQIARLGNPEAERYDVLYVLDGDHIFPGMVTLASAMQMNAEENAARPIIMVGIGYPNGLDLSQRAEDYTPPAADYSNTGDNHTDRFGGAEKFHRFLEEELKPEVESRFPIDKNNQSLFGHSYGGLFTLYSLFAYPGAFTNYLSSSPSTWWNNSTITRYQHSFVESYKPGKSIRAQVMVGEYEETPSPWLKDPVRSKKLQQRQMVSRAHAIVNEVKEKNLENLGIDFIEFAEETHSTAAARGALEALKFAFRNHTNPQ